MGRAFEFRKERKFKRWAKMAVQFTRLGKEIVLPATHDMNSERCNTRILRALPASHNGSINSLVNGTSRDWDTVAAVR